MVQLRIPAQCDRVSLVDIHQKIEDVLHHKQLFPAHPEGEGGIFVILWVEHHDPRQQPGIRVLRLQPCAALHVGFQQIPGVPVTDHPALGVLCAVNHRRRQVLAGVIEVKLDAAAAAQEPSRFLLLDGDLIGAVPLYLTVHFGQSRFHGMVYILHPVLLVVFHPPVKGLFVKHAPNLLHIQLDHSPTSRLFSTFYR